MRWTEKPGKCRHRGAQAPGNLMDRLSAHVPRSEPATSPLSAHVPPSAPWPPCVALPSQACLDFLTAWRLGSKLANGRLLGFPRRDTVTHQRHSISQASELQGQHGLKLPPPLGESSVKEAVALSSNMLPKGEGQTSDGRSDAAYVLVRHPTGLH